MHTMWYIDLQVLLICCFMPPAGRCEAVLSSGPAKQLVAVAPAVGS